MIFYKRTTKKLLKCVRPYVQAVILGYLFFLDSEATILLTSLVGRRDNDDNLTQSKTETMQTISLIF